MNELHIAPNRPLTVALVDPEGHFDFETGMGQYQTTTGELVTLPRPAVVLLNTLDPQPGEEITITKHWTGRPGDKAEDYRTVDRRARTFDLHHVDSFAIVERRADPDNIVLLCDTCHDWTHSRKNTNRLFLGRGQ